MPDFGQCNIVCGGLDDGGGDFGCSALNSCGGKVVLS